MDMNESVGGLARPKNVARARLLITRNALAKTQAPLQDISDADDKYDAVIFYAKRSIAGMVNDINDMLQFLDEIS